MVLATYLFWWPLSFCYDVGNCNFLVTFVLSWFLYTTISGFVMDWLARRPKNFTCGTTMRADGSAN